MNEIVIYKNSDSPIQVEMQFEQDTFWLTQAQITDLFGTIRPAISKHLSNIFKSGELDKKVVCSILVHATHQGTLKGKTQTVKVKHFNLDAVLSIGYRVNSLPATQFRI